MEQQQADIALIGLAVMGQNLILNMNDHGFVVCAFNRTVEKVDQFLANEAKGTNVVGAKSLKEMVGKLKSPRRVMLLVKGTCRENAMRQGRRRFDCSSEGCNWRYPVVKDGTSDPMIMMDHLMDHGKGRPLLVEQAGSAVDAFIDQLVPLLDKGDIIIDGGNSEYQDSQRRCKALGEKGILFVGSGVSGGEEGARHGPSLMPGGNPKAWSHIKDIFQSISAKADGDPCCDWVGEDGAGHFVKMVHNGIEYGDMQLICEAYQLMRDGLGMSNDEMGAVFTEWNKGELDSFLIEITRDILMYKEADGSALLDKIRDSAGQKGTGKWTAISALEYGIPVTLIGESVFARCLSSLKDERVNASKQLKGPQRKFQGNKTEFVEHIRKALYASKIISYAQGFMLLREAAKEFGWKLNYGSIALMWRGGCIIRSVFLGNIKSAFDKNPSLSNLLLDDFFKNAIHASQDSWRKTVAEAVLMGIPTPAFSTALAFYDGFRTENLPANMIQCMHEQMSNASHAPTVVGHKNGLIFASLPSKRRATTVVGFGFGNDESALSMVLVFWPCEIVESETCLSFECQQDGVEEWDVSSNPCDHPIVILRGVSFSHLQAIIHFIYHGEVDVSNDQLGEFLKAADLLHISGLAEEKSSKHENATLSPSKSTTRRRLSSSIERGEPSSLSQLVSAAAKLPPLSLTNLSNTSSSSNHRPSAQTYLSQPDPTERDARASSAAHSPQPSTPRSESPNTSDSERPLEIAEPSPSKRDGEMETDDSSLPSSLPGTAGVGAGAGGLSPMNLSMMGRAPFISPLLQQQIGLHGLKMETPGGDTSPASAAGSVGSSPSGGGGGGKMFSPSGRRPRTVFDHQQIMTLKTFYNYNTNPNSGEITRLAQGLGLDRKVVKVWFQNERAKHRKLAMLKANQESSPPSQTAITSAGGHFIPSGDDDSATGPPHSNSVGGRLLGALQQHLRAHGAALSSTDDENDRKEGVRRVKLEPGEDYSLAPRSPSRVSSPPLSARGYPPVANDRTSPLVRTRRPSSPDPGDAESGHGTSIQLPSTSVAASSLMS
ncbi:unnamed protein product [Cyprideis torosa]|uniref:6-phosphogluconate dehydrogenase, decarboxylating n=1 Tax=Cyprideis torosa TaxID=163714 RepID=A0A7R8ZI12_9CRUS|nr:unnamed protein product [Cyprideis torosa]CAG0879049.1 unnamed protein product [Cyprideis torosa]